MTHTLRLAVPLILIYAALSFMNYSVIDEDAFIYFRCVENTLAGNGYAFNPGERIEACSSLTWYALLCISGAAGLDPLIASKALGFIFGCLSIVVIIAITARFTVCMPWILLPALLTLLTPSFIIRNQMGLETALYCLVFLSLVLVSLDRSLLRYWPALAVVLACTRPEGIFLLLGLAGAVYVYKPGTKPVIAGVCGLLLLMAALSAGRFLYFHDFLPSPFYIKVYPDKLKTGIRYIHSFFSLTFLYWFIIPAAVLSLAQRFNEKMKLLLWYIVVFYAWVLLAGADDKPFYRHCLPGLPLIFLFGTIVFENFCTKMHKARQILVGTGITGFACASLLLATSHELFTFPFPVKVGNPLKENAVTALSEPASYFKGVVSRMRKPLETNHIGHSKEVLIGTFIKNSYPPGSTILYDQMGQTPYAAGMDYTFIDTWGLTDKKIGRYYLTVRAENSKVLWLYDTLSTALIKKVFPETVFFKTRQDALDYLFSVDPDVIMLTTILLYDSQNLIYSILQDDRLKTRYEPRFFIEDWVLVFEHKRLPQKQRIFPDSLKVIDSAAVIQAIVELDIL